MAVTVDDHGIPPVMMGLRLEEPYESRRGIVKYGSRSVGMMTMTGDQGMADLPRLSNVIRALEAGRHAPTSFAPAAIRA
jgi:hypothetical protein